MISSALTGGLGKGCKARTVLRSLVEEIVAGTLGDPESLRIAVFQDHEGDGYRTLPAHPPRSIRIFEVLDDEVADIAKIALQVLCLPCIRTIVGAKTGAGASSACSGARDPCSRPAARAASFGGVSRDRRPISGPAEN